MGISKESILYALDRQMVISLTAIKKGKAVKQRLNIRSALRKLHAFKQSEQRADR